MTKTNILNKEGYKADCGFKYKINRCSFKSKSCNHVDCDMFTINWDKKAIKGAIDFEKEQLLNLDKFCKLETTTKKEKKNYERKIQDKKIGLAYLNEALFYLRFGRFVEFKTIMRLGEKFLAKRQK